VKLSATVKEAVADARVEIPEKKLPKRILALPDLEHAKTALLNSLTSRSGQRTYDHAIREFVAWYCSEPRLAFNRTVVLRYRIHLETRCAQEVLVRTLRDAERPMAADRVVHSQRRESIAEHLSTRVASIGDVAHPDIPYGISGI
jgi:hypothetical protein